MTQKKHKVPWYLYPFWLIWRLVIGITPYRRLVGAYWFCIDDLRITYADRYRRSCWHSLDYLWVFTHVKGNFLTGERKKITPAYCRCN